MVSYRNYFTTWESTEAPPIQTPEYIRIKNQYQSMLSPIMNYEQPKISSIKDYSNKDNDFQLRFEYYTDYNSKPEDTGQKVANLARQFVGTKYSWGGSSPSTGFDCSGLIWYTYKQNGINLPRTVKDLEKVGKEVSLDNVRVGDIICFNSSGPSGKHVKLVSNIQDGQIFTIDAKNKNKGIVEEPLSNINNITTVRRISNMPSNIKANKESKYSNRTEWKQDLAQAYRDAGITNENAIRMLVAQDALESGWGKKAQGNYNYGNITAGSYWKGAVVIGKDHDAKGNPIKQRFRSYNSMDEYAKDKVSFLTRLYDFNQNDNIDIFTYKLQGGNHAGRKYAGSYSYIQGVKNVYKGLRI